MSNVIPFPKPKQKDHYCPKCEQKMQYGKEGNDRVVVCVSCLTFKKIK